MYNQIDIYVIIILVIIVCIICYLSYTNSTENFDNSGLIKPSNINTKIFDDINNEINSKDHNGCGCENKKKYLKLPYWHMFMEDPVMLGSNYNDYSNFVKPDNVDLRITQYKKKGYELAGEILPVASNYAFDNTIIFVDNTKKESSKIQ